MKVPYEGNGYASLSFLTWITSAEIVLLLLSLAVLGIAFLMFVRLFDALSPPTKALTWVVGGNFVLALHVLAFMCFQMHYYARKEFIPQGGAFCHYVNPLVLALIIFNWLGQPVIAWTTLKTLRNEPVPDQKLRRIYYACVAVAFITYVWGVALSPGVIVNGAFCVMIPKSPNSFDARAFGNMIGVATFFTALVFYVKSYRHLRRLKRKLEKDMKRIRHADADVEEAKEPGRDHSSQGHVSSHMSSSGGLSEWTGDAGRGGSATVGDVESGQAGTLGRGGSMGGLSGEWEDEDLDSLDDSDDNSEDDAPFTYEQLQARTQAARAAVNILLPNRTDEMAERQGPYGMHRRDARTRGRRLLEEGVDLSALMESKSQAPTQQAQRPAAARGEQGPTAEEARAPWWQVRRRWRRGQKQQQQDPNAEVVQLYSKATRAVVGRACTLLAVYYLPSYALYACMGAYKDFRPPAELLPIFGFVFHLGTPVLQTFALLHLAVTIGSNILQFYRQYQQGGGRAAEGGRAAIAGTEDEAVAVAVEGPPGTAEGGSAGFLYERGPAGPAAVATGAAGESAAHGGTVAPSFTVPMPDAQPVAVRRLGPLRPAPGPLGVPQPSAFRRYAGRQQKAAPPRPASRQGSMQALSTIYEVAFKSRGRDAATAFRQSIGASTAAGAGAAGAAAAGGGVAPEKGEPDGGRIGERKSTASDGSSGDDGDATTLQQNALVQEMLGVKVRGSSACKSSASGDSSGSVAGEDSAASSLSEDLSSGRSGSAEGESKGWAAVTGSYFPWRAGVRSRSMSIADGSEISSLTDAQDYQIGSLGTSPAMTPWGQKALTPVRPKRRVPSSSEEGGTSSDNPTSSSSSDSNSNNGRGSSTDSWEEKAAPGDSARATGSVSLAGMSHVSGSSGSSSNSSLASDGGRSLVTESDWRDWQLTNKDRRGVDGRQPQQQLPQAQSLAGPRAHRTPPN